ncbi:MAG TPA: DNA replication protein, partial [Clostridium sp.]
MRCETSEMISKINRLLKQFKLPDIHDRYDEEVQVAVENNIGHREFLYKILKVEEQGKMNRLRIRNIKNAHFDGQKT